MCFKSFFFSLFVNQKYNVYNLVNLYKHVSRFPSKDSQISTEHIQHRRGLMFNCKRVSVSHYNLKKCNSESSSYWRIFSTHMPCCSKCFVHHSFYLIKKHFKRVNIILVIYMCCYFCYVPCSILQAGNNKITGFSFFCLEKSYIFLGS